MFPIPDVFKWGDKEIDHCVDRVLSNPRVEKIARRITEMMLEQITEGLQARDSQKEA
jgi:hypothetical protein